MEFEFATASRLVFGAGKSSQLGSLAAGYGRKAVLVGSEAGRWREALEGQCRSAGVETLWVSVRGEPTVAWARAQIDRVREWGPDCVIALGGGSVLDAGKALGILARHSGDPLDYLEVVGRGVPFSEASVPVIAAPTTAGTGSEVTRNAVLLSEEHGVKASLRSASMLPRVAVVDPELTYSMSPEATASTGMDALTQLLEPFVCARHNPLVDGLCREGLGRVGRSLRQAVAAPTPQVREEMCLASLFGGMALANAGLGAVHGVAAVIGGMFRAPHGAVCAALLPSVTACNIRALTLDGKEEALARYQEAGKLLGSGQGTLDLVAWLGELALDLGIPGLEAYGVTPGGLEEIVRKSMQSSSMKANPVALTHPELEQALREAL